jgi:hypothetical protein
LWAGILTGLAVVLKFTTALPVGVFLFYGLWRDRQVRGQRLLAFAAGGALSVAAPVLWLQLGNALEAYLDIQLGFVVPYTRLHAADLGNTFQGVKRWGVQVWFPLLLAFGWLASRHNAKNDPEPPCRELVLLGALLAAFAAVVIQNKFFLYHWETALPWLALAAALGSIQLLKRCGVTGHHMILFATAVPLVWSLTGRWSAYRDGALWVAGALPTSRWLQRFTSQDRDYSFLADTQVATYVRAHTAPSQRILIWGFEPSVYLLANRRPPTRFFFNVPVAVPFSPQSWKNEFLADLNRNLPELFLVLRHDAIPWANGLKEDSSGQLRNWPALSAFLEQNYRFETQIEDFAIYRHKTNEPQMHVD